ncbi:MAG: AIR synthase-related protein, partial [Candidatus Omnitrophota bacterium]
QNMLCKVKVNSMIDISDGLFSDLKHILDESEKSAIIYESLVPVRLKKKTAYDALNIGEQFKILMTVSCSEIKNLPTGFYPIGEITTGACEIIYVDKNGKKRKAKPKGYAHF